MFARGQLEMTIGWFYKISGKIENKGVMHIWPPKNSISGVA